MYDKIYELLERHGRVKSAVALAGEHAGSRCIWQDGKLFASGEKETEYWRSYEGILETDSSGILEKEGILIEMFQKNPRMVILGAGHVSCPTAKIGSMLGFHVTVMDDREEFLTKERFPETDVLLRAGFEKLSELIPAYENTYYVVVTRGHKGDYACAQQILRRPYAYFGMIGSRNKVRITKERLLEEGFSEKQISSIHAPIGIPLGGQLPEEIAVSICAEIVQEKNRQKAVFTDDSISRAVREGRHGVMMTIIEKSGSSPRGIGSRMFLAEDGTSFGSIGGGNVEFTALRHALQISGAEVQSYCLSLDEPENLGMICGGKVKVLFEKV